MSYHSVTRLEIIYGEYTDGDPKSIDFHVENGHIPLVGEWVTFADDEVIHDRMKITQGAIYWRGRVAFREFHYEQSRRQSGVTVYCTVELTMERLEMVNEIKRTA